MRWSVLTTTDICIQTELDFSEDAWVNCRKQVICYLHRCVRFKQDWTDKVRLRNTRKLVCFNRAILSFRMSSHRNIQYKTWSILIQCLNDITNLLTAAREESSLIWVCWLLWFLLFQHTWIQCVCVCVCVRAWVRASERADCSNCLTCMSSLYRYKLFHGSGYTSVFIHACLLNIS